MNEDIKKLEKEAKELLESLQMNLSERRCLGLLGPFLQVLFEGLPQSSQTRVLKVMYDYQLIKEKQLNAPATESKE